jgi:sugar fermentation stimulation protein A
LFIEFIGQGVLEMSKKGALPVLEFNLTPLPNDIKEPITYCIILHLPDDKWIRIGQKGEIFFSSGFYAYVGSARKNASSRITRHWLGTGKKKWHIDYLRAETKPQSIWGFYQETLAECQLADFFRKLQVSFIPDFGSSDCHCSSHLFFCPNLIKLESLLSSLHGIHFKYFPKYERSFHDEPIS